MSQISIKTIGYVVIAALTAAPVWAQQTTPQPKREMQQKQQHQQQKAQNGSLRGKPEKLACILGDEDRQARIAVELIGGLVKSIAYYSKWKPRTCSVHIVRDDAWSKWQDTGSVTVVTLNEEKGSFLIDYEKRSVKFMFREIDRERFCGMEGKITGSLTVTRGQDRCELEGVMDEVKETEVKETVAKESVVKEPEAETQTAAVAQ